MTGDDDGQALIFMPGRLEHIPADPVEQRINRRPSRGRG